MTDCENAIQGQVRGLGDWVLVPCVPTDSMLRAAQSAWLNDPMRSTTTTTITMWAAMLAAAPAAPAPGADDVTTKTELLPLPGGNVAHLIATQVAEIEALRAEVAALRKAIDRAWNEGFDFAMKACGWQEGEDPSTEGLYVARDSKGNVEVGMWYAKTTNSYPAEWDREFRDVDRDDIVAWMAIPDWRTARDASKLSEAMLRARENTNQ